MKPVSSPVGPDSLLPGVLKLYDIIWHGSIFKHLVGYLLDTLNLLLSRLHSILVKCILEKIFFQFQCINKALYRL